MTPDPFVSYAQNLEDVMLWRALGTAVDGPGFYVDVGAADPTLLSVTRAFYDRGWRGVSVEPLPDVASRLADARPRDTVVAAALADTAGPRRFFRVTRNGQTGLSTLDPAEAERHRSGGAAVTALDVPVTTLALLCREHVDGPVHFLKIDVEGAEGAVLAGADFAAIRPWIVVVEATRPMSEAASETEWEPTLLNAGYALVWFDGLNRFYLANEHAALAHHFRTPPNVFDRYIQHDPGLQTHLTAIQTLEAEIARLTSLLAPPPPAPPQMPSPRPAWPRRLALAAYRLVRPVVRPIAWRTRTFLTGELMREIAGIRTTQETIIARVNAPGGGIDPGMARTMERLLLTLALEDGSNPNPPGLLPPHQETLSQKGG